MAAADPAAAAGSLSARPGPRFSPGFVAAVLALLMGLQPVTTDLMMPALPALAQDMGSPMAPVQLTMSTLILAFGLAQLFWGPVADRVGRRPVLLAGLALYTLASLGGALAGSVMLVVLWRALQGAALAAVVVCARTMVRDLYEPREGAMVMARALGGLGLLAISSPVIGGLLVAGHGWRASLLAMGLVSAACGLLIVLRVPETARHRQRDATRLRPLLRQIGLALRHPGFRAWAALVATTYGGLYVFLASAGFVLIGSVGLSPAAAGFMISTCAMAYISGTLLCRRWLPRLGLAASVGRAAWFTLAAALAMAVLAFKPQPGALAVMAPVWLYALGHGVHMPCGQTGVVGPFPRAAGLVSALAGFAMSCTAFVIGLWLGQALDGTARPLALGMAGAALVTVAVAWTLVRRDGERLDAH